MVAEACPLTSTLSAPVNRSQSSARTCSRSMSPSTHSANVCTHSCTLVSTSSTLVRPPSR